MAAAPIALPVAAAAALGVALRIAVYRSDLGIENSDEAMFGLMVRHALHGQFTVFGWGTVYGGTQEVLASVPVFAVCGSSLAALRVVPFVLNALAAVLVWRVGKRTIGDRPAVVAGALYWIWPPDALYLQTHQYGFYASNAFYCGLILLLVLRAAERPDAARMAWVGFVSGFAFWQTTQIGALVVPAIGWLVWRQPRCLRKAWLAVPLALVGALPWIAWNVVHHFGSLHPQAAASSSYLWRLRTIGSPVLPMALGLRLAPSMRWVLGNGAAAALYVLLAASFFWGAYRYRRQTRALLYVVTIVFPFVAMIPAKSFQTQDPRYLSVLMPVLALLVAQLARSVLPAALVLVVALAITAYNLHHENDRLQQTARLRVAPGGVPVGPRSLGPLIRSLEARNLHRVFANYWIAYRLSFESNERVIAVENKFDDAVVSHGVLEPLPDPFVKYKPYDTAVRESARHAFVFSTKVLPTVSFRRVLASHGYVPYRVQDFLVYSPSASR